MNVAIDTKELDDIAWGKKMCPECHHLDIYHDALCGFKIWASCGYSISTEQVRLLQAIKARELHKAGILTREGEKENE